MSTIDNDDDFVTDRINRKQQVKNRRKQSKRDRQGGDKKIHRVGKNKDRWQFNPNQIFESEE